MIAIVAYDLFGASSEDYETVDEALDQVGVRVQRSVWLIELETTPDELIRDLEDLTGPRAKILVATMPATSVATSPEHSGLVANWIAAHRSR